MHCTLHFWCLPIFSIATLYSCFVFLFTEPFWSQHRKLVNKAFSHKMLLSLLPTFNTEIDNLVNDLQQSMDKGEDIDLLVKLRVLTLKNSTSKCSRCISYVRIFKKFVTCFLFKERRWKETWTLQTSIPLPWQSILDSKFGNFFLYMNFSFAYGMSII